MSKDTKLADAGLAIVCEMLVANGDSKSQQMAAVDVVLSAVDFIKWSIRKEKFNDKKKAEAAFQAFFKGISDVFGEMVDVSEAPNE